MIQDLGLVNEAVYLSVPIVPNPATILSEITPTSQHFSITDLANAFFSIPVHSDSRYWFSFCFKGKLYQWNVMPQGLTNCY